MKKKSLVAMGLAGIMTVGMCVPVLAGTLNQDGTSGDVDVDFTIAQAYTVTIPTTLEVGTEEKEIAISATGNLIEGNQIKVKISNITDNGVSLAYYKAESETNPVADKNAKIKVVKGTSKTELTTTDNVAAVFSNGGAPKNEADLTNTISDLKLGAKPDTQAG